MQTDPSKPCLHGQAGSQEQKQKEADANSQLMPKFHFQNGLVGCSPARIPRDAQKSQHCVLNAQKMSVMRTAYVHWGKEIILPKLGPYNALHLQSILFNINKHSQTWA